VDTSRAPAGGLQVNEEGLTALRDQHRGAILGA
jgi:hypothetical protein